MLGAGVAHADPRFVLTESEARAGEVVHFSISRTERRAAYEVQVAERDVAEGSVAARTTVSGEFTMPDLGGSSRAVTVAAKIEESDETTTVTRKLLYVVPAPTPAGTSTPQLAPAPPPAPPPASPPAPPPTAQAVAAPEPTRGLRPDKPAKRQFNRKRTARRPAERSRERGTRRQESAPRAHRRRGRRSAVRRSRAKRRAPRTAPLFDGVPESPSAGSGPPSGGNGFLALNAIAPPTAALTAAPGPGPGGGPTAAVVIPALLGLATLLLAGTAVARRRRLAQSR